MRARLHKILVGLLCLLFGGCHKAEEQRSVLTFWSMGAEGEHIRLLLPRFHALHPNIEVKVQAIPWNAAHDLLLTAFAGGTFPDVCQLGNTWIPEFQAIGAIAPLDSIIRHSSIDEQQFFAGIWQTNIINGRLYGIPWYVDTRLLFYRRDLLKKAGFEHPPQTWDQWLQLCRRLKQLHASDYGIFLSTIFNDWQVPVILIMQNNGRLLRDDDCYGAFDDPATMEALEFYLQFFREDLAVKNMSEVANIFQGFNDGVFAMLITGPWNVHEMRRRLPQLQGKWTTAVLPQQKNRASTAGGSSLVINKNSSRLKEALLFIQYLTDVETQRQFFTLTHDLPAVKEAWQTEEIQNDAEIMAFYQQLEHVQPTPKIAEWEQVAVKLQEYLELVIFERLTLEDAVKKLNHDVDRILEKRRWLMKRGLL